ncbi:MAG: ATP-binding cassette domain-containing protein, partial [Chloroflexota bacterium]
MTNNILEVQHVTVSFDGFTVLDDLNFAMEKGELRFLIGPNGAGKTTLLDIITGKTNPSTGSVILDGQDDISRWSEHQIVQAGVGRKFQTPSVFSSLTVFENLEAAISFKESSWGLMRKTDHQYHEKIDETLAIIGLVDQAELRAG